MDRGRDALHDSTTTDGLNSDRVDTTRMDKAAGNAILFPPSSENTVRCIAV